MQSNLTPHEKAQLTCQMLKKRRAEKEKEKDYTYTDVKFEAFKRCNWKKYRRH